jgi:hypothetical protein
MAMKTKVVRPVEYGTEIKIPANFTFYKSEKCFFRPVFDAHSYALLRWTRNA